MMLSNYGRKIKQEWSNIILYDVNMDILIITKQNQGCVERNALFIQYIHIYYFIYINHWKSQFCFVSLYLALN